MPIKPSYFSIVDHYGRCLGQHGDTHCGVDWPKVADVSTRHRIMLEMLRPSNQRVKVLDFGCGTAHLLDYIKRHELSNITYAGLDILEQSIAICKKKHSDRSFYCCDILSSPDVVPVFDYIVMNGVLTVKCDLSFDAMWSYTRALLKVVFTKVRYGFAFNVMAAQVDWEREDLFHLPFDTLAWFLCRELSRHFVVRNDYGLYEYTVYVYKKPIAGEFEA